MYHFTQMLGNLGSKFQLLFPKIMNFKQATAMCNHPTIAQLAERETVEVKQLSLGHWFESGWSEILKKSPFCCLYQEKKIRES